jgi:hypothetical protein
MACPAPPFNRDRREIGEIVFHSGQAWRSGMLFTSWTTTHVNPLAGDQLVLEIGPGPQIGIRAPVIR